MLSHGWLFVTPWPSSSVHAIFQARMLECVAIFYSRGSSPPKGQTRISCVSCLGRQALYYWRHLGSPMPRIPAWCLFFFFFQFIMLFQFLCNVVSLLRLILRLIRSFYNVALQVSFKVLFSILFSISQDFLHCPTVLLWEPQERTVLSNFFNVGHF